MVLLGILCIVQVKNRADMLKEDYDYSSIQCPNKDEPPVELEEVNLDRSLPKKEQQGYEHCYCSVEL